MTAFKGTFLLSVSMTLKTFCANVNTKENLSMLTFAQGISKAHDLEAGLKTESAITKCHLEETAHRVTPAMD